MGLSPARVLLDRIRWRGGPAADQDAGIARLAPGLAPAFEPVEARVFAQGATRERLAIFRHGRSGLAFALVPGGSYLVGAGAGEPREEGRPGRVVRMPPFLIAL